MEHVPTIDGILREIKSGSIGPWLHDAERRHPGVQWKMLDLVLLAHTPGGMEIVEKVVRARYAELRAASARKDAAELSRGKR